MTNWYCHPVSVYVNIKFALAHDYMEMTTSGDFRPTSTVAVENRSDTLITQVTLPSNISHYRRVISTLFQIFHSHTASRIITVLSTSCFWMCHSHRIGHIITVLSAFSFRFLTPVPQVTLSLCHQHLVFDVSHPWNRSHYHRVIRFVIPTPQVTPSPCSEYPIPDSSLRFHHRVIHLHIQLFHPHPEVTGHIFSPH